ncbi:hypothetical protein AAG570_003543 [Ranatra chinensis]|uniref:Farnesol dehydrogenase-like n=1 Tax=Ranatra chinensis TaxID=642074 RepID=A0ABD0YQQ0_9HEMI
MDRWSGKTAVVTGASSGIGRAIALALAEEGLTVVAVARRDQRLKELASRVEGKGRIHGYTGDITDDDQLKSLFEWVEKNLGPVHVLVNNAGTTIPTRVSEGDMSNWRRMYSLNVFAVGGCIREALASMRRHGVDDGHIVNINSISGHPAAHVPGSWVYASTKHAITVLTEGLMRELVEDKSSIKVTVRLIMCNYFFYLSQMT